MITRLHNCIIHRNEVGIEGYIGGSYGGAEKVLNFQGILDGYVGRVGFWVRVFEKVWKYSMVIILYAKV